MLEDEGRERTKDMEKRIVIFNNATGIVDVMGPLFVREGMRMLVTADMQQLEMLLMKGNVHLIMIDMEWEVYGLESGIEMIAALRKKRITFRGFILGNNRYLFILWQVQCAVKPGHATTYN